MAFFRQFGILMTKQFLLSIRNWKSTLVQIAAPIIICFILFGFQKLSDSVLGKTDEFPVTTPLNTLPRCTERNGVPCTTLFYMPPVEWVEDIMRSVARQSGLEFGTDIVAYHNDQSIFLLDYYNMTVYFEEHQNQTQNAVLFFAGYESPTVMPTDPGYILFYNFTQYGYTPELVKMLNQAIFEVKANITDVEDSQAFNFLELTKRQYPYKFRISVYDVVASNGATWFFLPPMITFFIVLTEIVAEKEKRLRLGMRMMGLSNTAYWLTWWLTGVILTSLSTIVMIATGCAFQFAFFLNSFPIATFMLFFFFGVAMTSFGMFVSVFINSSGTAQTVGYAFILVGFVFQIVLSSGDGILIDLMWTKDVEQWVVGIRWGLTWYPPFNMAKVFSDIAAKAADTIDPIGGRVVKGTGFYWADLWSRREIDIGSVNIFMDVPAPAETFGWLCVSAASYIVLMWYLDNVLPGEHGSPRPLYFFVTDFIKTISWVFGGCKSRDRSSITYRPVSQSPSHNSSSKHERVEQEGSSANLIVELEGVDQDISLENERAFDKDSFVPLRICGISKIFRQNFLCSSKKDVMAVDNFSLVGEQDEILCLLGHNGAGKTTLVNMLTGLFPPTFGEAFIYDMNIAEEMDDIRQVLGVCPQHDILWPDLTAREHLRLFAKLKGIDDIEEQVNSILADVKLSHVGDNPVASFSGGMKRRLSIGISTIGNPNIIFMDEPTTGLDPVNKRRVWGMIQGLKKNRVIILTTHSMEEADILSDKVAIMAFGSLKCVGSSLHLKNKFGKGYRIHVSTGDYQVNALVGKLTSKFSKLKLEESEAGNLQFTVSRSHQHIIPSILNYLEENPDGYVNEWGLGHATLEEVFLRVTKESNFVSGERKEGDIAPQTVATVPTKVTKSMAPRKPGSELPDQEKDVEVSEEKHFNDKEYESLDANELQTTINNNLNDSRDSLQPNDNSSKITTAPSSGSERKYNYNGKNGSYPLRALFRKNLTLQKRQTCTNVCQVVTPVLVVLIMLILQLIIKGQLGANFDIKVMVETIPYPINSPYSFGDLLDYLLHPSIFPKNYPNHVGALRTGQCLEFFLYADATGKSGGVLGNSTHHWPNNRDYFTFFGNIPQDRCYPNESSALSAIPYFEQRTDDLTLQKEVFNLLDLYNNAPLDQVNKLPIRNYMPDGYIIFKEVSLQNRSLKATISVNSLGILNYHRSNNFSRSGFNFPKNVTNNPAFQSFQLLINEGFTQMVDLVSRAWFNLTLNSEGLPALTPTVNGLTSARFIQAIPYEQSPSILNIVEGFGSFLFPLAMTMQLPVYAFLLVLEKKEKLREMMKSHGMVTWKYYVVNYLFFFVLYALSLAFFWFSGLGVKIRFFSQTHWSTLLTFFLGWGFSLVSLSFVISAFLNDPRAATVTGYAVAMIGTLTAIGICVGIYGPFSFSTHSQLPQSSFIWPQMAFVRGIYVMNYACAQQFTCYGAISTLSSSDELVSCTIALYLTGVLYWVVFLYLDTVLPREYGIPKHPLFFLMPLWDLIAGKKKEEIVDAEKGGLLSDYEEDEDADVAKIRKKVSQNDYNVQDDPLVLASLRKVFPEATPPKVAVKNLCLVVKKNTIFGLLGENGAGKTTTISMLTGLYPPTSGTAHVGGFDITRDIDNVHLVMGLCPQFDILWEDLSAKEHLLFYARLKGIPPDHEDEHVNDVLKSVGLYQARHRLSRQLSGGMKRRLSLAIALVGSSKITFLDEPTTGLDPATRRHIWTIIGGAKKNRAIVLTTHSMDEAETLCNDIGILAHGTLRCTGSPQHLRSTHGAGYLLSVAYIPDSANTAEKFIKASFPVAVTISRYNRTMEFRIPPNTVKVSQLFAHMESNTGQNIKSNNNVIDWAITQLGLDSIFQNIVAKSNRENSTFNVENVGFEEEFHHDDGNSSNAKQVPLIDDDRDNQKISKKRN